MLLRTAGVSQQPPAENARISRDTIRKLEEGIRHTGARRDGGERVTGL
jgi:hypothetical protein